MPAWHFIDPQGVAWMVLAGLPEEYPVSAAPRDIAGFGGFTFRSSSGELRVLAADSMPRPHSADINVPPYGSGSRISPFAVSYWNALLSKASSWQA
jgi:hypothetical protein